MNAQIPVKESAHPSETNRGVARWLIRELMGIVMIAVILMLAANRWDWAAGWALVSITALWVAATALVVIPRHPELLAERVGPKKGTKSWDMALLGALGVITLVRYVVAGFDARYGWTTGISIPAQAIAFGMAAIGYGLVVWATGTNAYFAQTVRIQTERGHKVISGGPYRLMRHPAYTGMILFELASAIMLASWWALLLSAVSSVLFIIRTALEDRTLQAELRGYADYAQQTRFRLLPGLW